MTHVDSMRVEQPNAPGAPGEQEGERVDEPTVAYTRMAVKWELLHDLLGGTKAMRAAGAKWLPMEEKEQDPAYITRLNRSYLYNAFKDTIEKLASRPFSRDVTLRGEESLDDSLTSIAENVDATGTGLTQFARELLKSAIVHGVTHVLVDFTNVNGDDDDETDETPKVDDDGKSRTLADDREAGVRPVFVHVPAPQLIGWRSKLVNNQRVLTQIRIMETRVEDFGEFGDMEVRHVRVFTQSDWQLHRQDPETDEWKEIESGSHTFGAVPLVTFYVNKTGFLEAEPPLEDLGWLNLAHWQSLSDQRNILRFARVGLLFAAGLTDEQVEQGFVLAANRVIATTDPNASMKYVEHTGKAIGAGAEDLKSLEDRMEILGLAPFTRQAGTQTATGRAIDESRTQSGVQAWIRSEETAIRTCFEFAGRWADANFELNDDFVVDIFNEFGLTMRAAEDIEALIKMREKRQITQETLLNEVKRRGLLGDAVDVKLEIQNIEAEGPKLEDLLPKGEDEDDDEVEDDDEDKDAAE